MYIRFSKHMPKVVFIRNEKMKMFLIGNIIFNDHLSFQAEILKVLICSGLLKFLNSVT